MSRLKKILKSNWWLMMILPTVTVKAFIRLYQKTLSPDHGPLRHVLPMGACKFHPTCSNYTLDAIDEWGLFRGLFMGAARIMRCTPWAECGYDPVPKRK